VTGSVDKTFCGQAVTDWGVFWYSSSVRVHRHKFWAGDILKGLKLHSPVYTFFFWVKLSGLGGWLNTPPLLGTNVTESKCFGFNYYSVWKCWLYLIVGRKVSVKGWSRATDFVSPYPNHSNTARLLVATVITNSFSAPPPPPPAPPPPRSYLTGGVILILSRHLYLCDILIWDRSYEMYFYIQLYTSVQNVHKSQANFLN
jgi:hypothetical protein